MTREEAIEVFEGVGELESISMFYQPGGKAGKLTIHGIKEASRMAISALHTRQTPPAKPLSGEAATGLSRPEGTHGWAEACGRGVNFAIE